MRNRGPVSRCCCDGIITRIPCFGPGEENPRPSFSTSDFLNNPRITRVGNDVEDDVIYNPGFSVVFGPHVSTSASEGVNALVNSDFDDPNIVTASVSGLSLEHLTTQPASSDLVMSIRVSLGVGVALGADSWSAVVRTRATIRPDGTFIGFDESFSTTLRANSVQFGSGFSESDSLQAGSMSVTVNLSTGAVSGGGLQTSFNEPLPRRCSVIEFSCGMDFANLISESTSTYSGRTAIGSLSCSVT